MYAGLWMFAWDLADEGADKVMGWASDSGLTALQIATAYHAGWFIHPHNPRHRAYMTEDGTVYFHPTRQLYAETILKPQVASVCAETDWIREAGARLERYHLQLVSWTVCAHNTRLGRLHPECTVRNCFGDRYPHALCPSNAHYRAYVKALCQDIANNLPMAMVQLESPGFMGLVHGHHHERDLTVLSPLEQTLMSLPFSEGCLERAKAKGVDAEGIRVAVQNILEAAMANAPGRPRNHPQSMEEVTARIPELTAYQSLLKEIEDTLIQEIKAAMQPSPAKLVLLDGYNPALDNALDGYYVWGYGLRPAPMKKAVQAAKAPLKPHQKLYAGIRLGLNSVQSASDLANIVQAARDGGADGVKFYNYSESPMTALNWIKPALARVRES